MAAPTPKARSIRLWLRALANAVALPGVFAGLVPYLIGSSSVGAVRAPVAVQPLRLIGLLPLLLGLAGLAWTIRDFVVKGHGTLAPWDPPQTLVVTGLYRHVRNPMYVAVVWVIAGEAMLWGSWIVAAYGAVIFAIFHARVLFYEEPTLARQFGAAFARYREAVPRWMPRLRAARDRWTRS